MNNYIWLVERSEYKEKLFWPFDKALLKRKAIWKPLCAYAAPNKKKAIELLEEVRSDEVFDDPTKHRLRKYKSCD